MNKKLLLGFWLLIFINYTIAIVPASIDRTSLNIGQSLTLTIDVSKTDSDPDLNVLRGLFDISGTSSSSQTSIINGNMSSQKNLIINLSPKNLGKQVIPAIKVGNDATAPISIEVTKQSMSEQADGKSQIFIDTKLADKKSYIGVPIIYTMKLYYVVNLTDVRMSDINVKGATIQPIGKNTNYMENIKGVNYQVLEQKFQVTPNQAGNIIIPPIKISGAMIDSNEANNFFSMNTPRAFSVASKEATILVKAIPSGITQDQWFPAKQVTISEAQSNSTTIKLGQPITRTITVTALGVPDTSIPELNLAVPPNVNAYPDKTIASNSSNGNDFLSTKVFKVAYIPTQAGVIDFPETSIKWWDITTEMLKTAIIPAKRYTVLNENGSVQNIQPNIQIKNNQLPPTAVTYPSTATVSNQKSIWFFVTIAITILWLVTILTGVILFKKKAINTKNNSITINEKLDDEKKAKDLVIKSSKQKNVAALNAALIKWASLHFNKKIYTVLDIKNLSTNHTLNRLIDEFNQTIYRGSSFENFDALAHEIDMFALNNKLVKNNQGLKDLYPD